MIKIIDLLHNNMKNLNKNNHQNINKAKNQNLINKCTTFNEQGIFKKLFSKSVINLNIY